MLPPVLQKPANFVLEKIRRTPWYYKKFNNTLPMGLNRLYNNYQKDCHRTYMAANPGKTLGESEIRKNGAIRIKSVFPPEKAKAYSAKITKMNEENDPHAVHPKGLEQFQVRIEDSLRSLGEDMMDIFKNPEMDKALTEYFGGYYRIQWLSCLRSLPTNEIMASWRWHTDSYPPHTLKIFLHLSPATPDTGVTEFMNLEDTMMYHKAGYFGQHMHERTEDLDAFAKAKNLPFRPFHLDAEAGDATLFDVNFFHRGVNPRTDIRDVVQFFLLPNDIPWYEQYKKDGIDGLKMTGHGGYPKDPRPGNRTVSGGMM